ncbi:MAG: CopD family protein [Lutibacter sp.]
MGTVYLISVFIHVICAAFWIGGMLFIPLILVPSIKKQPNRVLLLYETGIKFRFYGWISVMVLFVTGFLNMYFRGLPFTIEFFTNSNYGKLLSLKLTLFVLMLLIGGIHDFYYGIKSIDEMKTTSNTKFKRIARLTGMLNLLLALIIAFLGIAISRGGF